MSGENEELLLTIEGEKEVREIRNILITNQDQKDEIPEDFFYFNQDQEITDHTQKIKDVFNAGDVVTVHKGDIPQTKGMFGGRRWKNLKSINNKTDGKIILVLRTKYLGTATPFLEEKWDAIDFNLWRTDVELCW